MIVFPVKFILSGLSGGVRNTRSILLWLLGDQIIVNAVFERTWVENHVCILHFRASSEFSAIASCVQHVRLCFVCPYLFLRNIYVMSEVLSQLRNFTDKRLVSVLVQRIEKFLEMGFPTEWFVQTIVARFICVICHQVLEDPQFVTTGCFLHYCSSCISK